MANYTRAEHLVDGWVHVIGVSASIIAAAILMWLAIAERSTVSAVSLAVYAAGLVAVFSFSAAYHTAALPDWKEALRRLDHAAIFVMIAGTYTPFALVKIAAPWGYALCAVVWSVAALGVTIKLAWPRRFERTSIVLYLAQGWAVLAVIEPLWSAVSISALILLAAGGVVYTAGVGVYHWRRLPYHNAVWHALVLIAAGCHYAAVLGSVALADS